MALPSLSAWGLSGLWERWEIPLAILGISALGECLTRLWRQQGLVAFLIQLGLQIAAITCLAATIREPTHWQTSPWVPQAFCLLAGGLLCVSTGGEFVGHIIAPLASRLKNENEGLPQAGRLIGQFERTLAFMLILAGEAKGIGFLIAAKSVFRFGDIQGDERSESEYIIIGTLASFTWGLGVSFLTFYGLNFL